jgi:REP element-mobilizing transposase RayT
MPRGTRLDAPGSIHHVLTRGIDRRALFKDDVDRRAYLERLARIFVESATRCLAWALLPNHVHLVVRTGARPLSTVMQRLGTGYARAFNARHGRVGHVFQGRYTSLLVEEDAYLLVLVRYVHRNPIEAGLVSSLADRTDHPWTGHSVLMGRRTAVFQATSEVLRHFGARPELARRRLVAWMEASDRTRVPGPTICGDPEVVVSGEPIHRDARLLGSRRFAGTVLDDLEGSERSRRRLWPGGGIEEFIQRVCERLGADPRRLREGRKSAAEVRARAAICHLASQAFGIPYTKLAPRLGVSHSALSRAASRGAEIVRDHALGLRDLGPPE